MCISFLLRRVFVSNAQMPAILRAYAVTNQPATSDYVVPRLLHKRHLPSYLLELPRSLRPLLSDDDEQCERARQPQLCRVSCPDVLLGHPARRPLPPLSEFSHRGATPPTLFGNCGATSSRPPLLGLHYD